MKDKHKNEIDVNNPEEIRFFSIRQNRTRDLQGNRVGKCFMRRLIEDLWSDNFLEVLRSLASKSLKNFSFK